MKTYRNLLLIVLLWAVLWFWFQYYQRTSQDISIPAEETQDVLVEEEDTSIWETTLDQPDPFQFPDIRAEEDKFNFRIVYEDSFSDFFALDPDEYFPEDEDISIFQLLQKIAENHDLSLDYSIHPDFWVYLEWINGYPSDENPDFYWAYLVNGIDPEFGIDNYFPEVGDSIFLFNYKWVPEDDPTYQAFLRQAQLDITDLSFEEFTERYDEEYRRYLRDTWLSVNDITFNQYMELNYLR